MIDLSPELVVIVMFGGALIGILLGYPVALVLGGVAMFVGFVTLGDPVFTVFRLRMLGFVTSYIMLAVPLFLFMGIMMEKSGTAERLYGCLYLWCGGLRGGLGVATIVLGTILAACVGVIAASVTMMGLIAAPAMTKRRYNKELIAGSICAGGTLGILIPPSIMLVIYGPMALISVGRLFMAAIIPGVVLSTLYIAYIVVRCWLQPSLAMAIPAEERTASLWEKISLLLTALVPPVFIVIAVLGSIFFGIATPTEASGVGALASILLAAAYRRLNWETLKATVQATMKITSMIFLIGLSATMFTGVFLWLRGGEPIASLLLAVPGGRWGTFAAIMVMIFILGKFIDWLGILFIVIPIVTPIGAALGFDPLWFAMMIIINLQISFLSPPFAYAHFFLMSVLEPESGITIAHIVRGSIPFIVIIMVALGAFIAFPQLILWLPDMMI